NLPNNNLRTNERGNARTATPGNLPNSNLPNNARGNARTATPNLGAPNTTAQGPAARGRDLTTAAALTRTPGGRLGIRNPAFPSPNGRDAATRALSHRTFDGRFARSTADWGRDWRFRFRHRHHFPFVLGFIGPLFWPYAYDDFIDYTFYPSAYDTFWPYAYDDVYAGIFGGYTPDVAAYASTEEGVAGGPRPRGGGNDRVANAPPSGGGVAEPICTGQTQGLTDFPIQKIAEQVQPTPEQQPLLDALKAATEQALQAMQQACPTDLLSTPVARMAAMRDRVAAMLKAGQAVPAALRRCAAGRADRQ